ncbi:MAG: phosphoenolpyruvate carboxykinase domain-containing protein, partial [Phycisphaerae bacterium]|nr:phosphoenolpyruvate carboxykinase domain-containing protein [Phycisphaerae bacterium]
GVPAWMGMGVDLPADGTNYQGAWTSDMTDVNPSHKNARYTVRINSLANADVKADAPDGVELGAIVYGGRDSDISVPVQQSYDWAHGIMIGASLESETTAATLGAEGVRTFNPMSNMDFLSMPLSQYIGNNLDFAGKLDAEPMIFGVNYFLKKDGKFLNGKLDKGIWVKWMELRVHGEVEAIPSPTGLIPKHEDLARLFKQYRDFDYTEQMYVDQFTIRIPENLAKLDRIGEIYAGTPNTPAALTDAMDAQRKRLTDVQAEKGDYVSPLDL